MMHVWVNQIEQFLIYFYKAHYLSEVLIHAPKTFTLIWKASSGKYRLKVNPFPLYRVKRMENKVKIGHFSLVTCADAFKSTIELGLFQRRE
mmetsp:Transcript_24104/g.62901  ORF Transcript_24104/g.62901 Transcript_24104/m.62901 type:complete len:91 (+) Transcript_24104:11252-11524(+)